VFIVAASRPESGECGESYDVAGARLKRGVRAARKSIGSAGLQQKVFAAGV